MTFRVSGGVLLAWATFACAPFAAGRVPAARDLPLTRAEATGYLETSTHADVLTFLGRLRAADAGRSLHFGTLGTSTEGRAIPFAVASRPRVTSPREARALGRAVVYVQGNIHGGEVEGKEALLMLLRALAFDPRPNVLDSVVLIAVPLYNPDGNDDLGPQERNRGSQNGPALVGRRGNGMGLDLNRDYMKAEAPETRGSLALFDEWDPDVFVDLHATNGSFHGYALTYSPPLNPAAPLEEYTRGLLDLLRERMRVWHGFETFEYGNFGVDETPWRERTVYTPAVHAWTTFDSRPRFSTNYYGLRNGIGILSEAFSHDPFDRRVASTGAFVREILSLAGERSGEIRELRSAASRRAGAPGGDTLAAGHTRRLPVRARFTTSPDTAAVLVEEIRLTGDSIRFAAGLPPGLQRTGRFTPVPMPLFTRFEPTVIAEPGIGYVVPARFERVLALLRAHGVAVERVGDRRFQSWEFVIDSIARAARPFEGHHETRVFGGWHAARTWPDARDHFVPLAQAGWRLAAYLLEPESDDGVVNWSLLRDDLAVGARYPILSVRVLSD